tara:strand:+ start:502 stop:987 length:486 start_codon:yes stop_codon:yes gene_type:complete
MNTIRNLGLNILEYFGVNNYDKITNNIYLGNYKASKMEVIDKEKFDVVINCTATLPFYRNNIYNHRLNVHDDLTTISNTKLFQNILRILPVIHNHVQNNRKILIHCKAGMQRSVTLVIAYLVKYHKLSISQAEQYVKSKRSVAYMTGSNFNLCLVMLDKNL